MNMQQTPNPEKVFSLKWMQCQLRKNLMYLKKMIAMRDGFPVHRSLLLFSAPPPPRSPSNSPLEKILSTPLLGLTNTVFSEILILSSDADPYELLYGSGSWIRRFSIWIQIRIRKFSLRIQGKRSNFYFPPNKLR